jgi:hypothetical protein
MIFAKRSATDDALAAQIARHEERLDALTQGLATVTARLSAEHVAMMVLVCVLYVETLARDDHPQALAADWRARADAFLDVAYPAAERAADPLVEHAAHLTAQLVDRLMGQVVSGVPAGAGATMH